MHDIHMFDRRGPLDIEGFAGSGADWLERYKSFINDGKTVVTSPHKLYGPQSNDLVLQLRKRGVNKVLLAGMSANLCTESHLRELQEQGFEVAVAWDATGGGAAPRAGRHGRRPGEFPDARQRDNDNPEGACRLLRVQAHSLTRRPSTFGYQTPRQPRMLTRPRKHRPTMGVQVNDTQ